MTTASNIFNNALTRYRRRQAFLKYGIREIPSTSIQRRLSNEQKQEVDTLWGPLQYRTNYRWHEFYYGLTGTFDVRYLPSDVHFMSILPKLNNASLRLAWEDKSFYSTKFPDIPFPTSLAYCIQGRLYDSDHNPLSLSALLACLRQYPEVLVKPTLDTYCGKGVELFNPTHTTEDDLQHANTSREGNCVYQVPIQQHEITATLNSSSVNIIRINTLRVHNECHVLNATIRFGNPGSRTDVSFDTQGIERLNLIGIDKNNRLMDGAYTAQGERLSLASYGLDATVVVPGMDKAYEYCLSIHRRLLHFDLVAFDVAIDASGQPIVVELNLGTPGATFYQFMHGPFYGGYTEDIIQLATNS